MELYICAVRKLNELQPYPRIGKNKFILAVIDNVLKIYPSERSLPNDLIFDTYEDHRMAMSLASLAVYAPVSIANPKVVNKSYPGFWDDMKKCGFDLVQS